jgi:hypothetical protein
MRLVVGNRDRRQGKRDLLVLTADGVKEPQNRWVQIVYDGGAAS